jgi:gluconokinase
MAERALALDLGSSSVRAIVFERDALGSVTAVDGATARRPRRLSAIEHGQATFDGDDYLSDLVSCLDELSAKGGLKGVGAVAMDSQWHSIVPVDREGKPLGEMLSWADTRPEHPLAVARHSATVIPGPTPAPGPRAPGARTGADPGWADRLEQLRQRTGCAVASMYWTCRAPWLLARAAGGKVARFLGLPELVGLRLLNDPSTSLSMASGTGLLATADGDWDAEALEFAGLSRSQLPPLAPPSWRGSLAPAWRSRWPELANAPWHPVLGDGAAATLGAGCDRPGWATMTIGTSAAVRAVRAVPGPSPLAPGLWRYCVDRERVVLGAAFSSGGQLYSWALSLGKAAPAGRGGHGEAPDIGYDLETTVAAGSEGVLVLPWHAGTRPPALRVPSGQGCIVGLGLGHTGAHIVSAAVEAVCFELARGLAELEGQGEGALKIVANGGALDRTPWWKVRLASTLDRPIRCPVVSETTARGAAAYALGVDLGTGLADEEVVNPVRADAVALAEARRRWSRWYSDLLPVVGTGSGPEALHRDAVGPGAKGDTD